MSAAPDPAFVAWYNDEWQKMLEGARVPGWDEPISWGRRAAWLLWEACRPVAGQPKAVRAPAAVFSDLLPPVPALPAGLLPR